MLTAICLMTSINSGCTLTGGFIGVLWEYMVFWETLPVLPISAYHSQRIEDELWENERYNRVPVLDPIAGENAPVFCVDPPSDDQIMRALPDEVSGGIAFLQETQRNNVRIVKSLIADYVDPPRFYPLIGPAQLHHAHYKCTVFFEEVKRIGWPVPHTIRNREAVEVIYIDHNHFHMVGNVDLSKTANY